MGCGGCRGHVWLCHTALTPSVKFDVSFAFGLTLAIVICLQVLSINEEGLRRCEENTKVFGRPIRLVGPYLGPYKEQELNSFS